MALAGLGNLFSSLGQSISDTKTEKEREAELAAQRLMQQQQMDLMMKQFLAGQAKDAAASINPDETGSAGSLSPDDPRLAFIRKNAPYLDRSTPGMTLPSQGTAGMSTGAPGEGATSMMGKESTPTTPTGMFTWRPTFEQQQQMEAPARQAAATASEREFEQSLETQRQKATAGEGALNRAGELERAKITSAGEMARVITEGKQRMAEVQAQLGNKATPQQQGAIRILSALYDHPPKDETGGVDTTSPAYQAWFADIQKFESMLAGGAAPGNISDYLNGAMKNRNFGSSPAPTVSAPSAGNSNPLGLNLK